MEPPADRIARRRREIPEYKKNGEALATLVGVSRQQLSKWENGGAMPTGENLTRLADALGVTPAWILFGDAGDMVEIHGKPFPRVDLAKLSEAGRSSVVREEPAAYGVEVEGGPGSPAEQLLTFLSERLGHRRVAGELTDKDLIATAYTLARKHAFSAEDFQLLDRWRDQIIQGEKKG